MLLDNFLVKLYFRGIFDVLLLHYVPYLIYLVFNICYQYSLKSLIKHFFIFKYIWFTIKYLMSHEYVFDGYVLVFVSKLVYHVL